MYWYLLNSLCNSLRPSVGAQTQERFDLLTPNLACRSLWQRARSLLIFSPLCQTPLMFFALLYVVLFMSLIESSDKIKIMTSRSDPKVKVQPHMTPNDSPCNPKWPQIWPQFTPIFAYLHIHMSKISLILFYSITMLWLYFWASYTSKAFFYISSLFFSGCSFKAK